jgi:hypothetical protein
MGTVKPEQWPALPYNEWRATRDTLHMYTQVVGKLRLALSPFEPEWANVPLYVTARGLSTSPMPVGLRTIDIEFDLVDHVLVIRGSDGHLERRPLGGTVADFYRDVMAVLERMEVDVAISVVPSEVADPIPFPEDRTHDTYDTAHAARFQQVLTMADVVVKQHHARFRGRTTPVQFFWGTFDLALTRYSGERAQPTPGAGVIRRVGQDAEEICVGWWPGSEGVSYPAFYAYGFPAPDGIAAAGIRPGGAAWSDAAGEFLYPYDAARAEAVPSRAILDFFESTYAAAAGAMGWNSDLVDVAAPDSSHHVSQ